MEYALDCCARAIRYRFALKNFVALYAFVNFPKGLNAADYALGLRDWLYTHLGRDHLARTMGDATIDDASMRTAPDGISYDTDLFI